ncbi:MAG: hypothetical protein QOH15_436 [Gaiellales bacterium]|jgi:hypothetical protein|nr:hypothetical protein [Gaiellales bacterium]
MWTWVIIVGLYLVGAGFSYLLGGVGSAADALEGWGRSCASLRRHPSSASS